MKALNSRDRKKIHSLLKEIYEVDDSFDIGSDYYVFEDKEKIFVVGKDFEPDAVSDLNVKQIGIVFGMMKDGAIELTIEGSQIIGKVCKNVFQVKDERSWLRGLDVECNPDLSGYFIITNGSEFMGCGKADSGNMINLLDKNRIVKSKD